MSEDPKEIIRTEDNKKRAQNLREDLPVWLLISEMNPSSSLIKIDLDKNQNYKISYKNKKTGFFQERFATLCEKVFRVRFCGWQLALEAGVVCLDRSVLVFTISLAFTSLCPWKVE